MSSFDKSQSVYERKLARQRQLELMEAAVGGADDSDDSDDDDDALTTRKSGADQVSTQAMENARRFLWDEDEDEENTPTMGDISITGTAAMFSSKEYVIDQSVNLMDPSQSHARAPPNKASFMASAFGNKKYNPDRFNDASASGESEEYISKRRRGNRLNPVHAACLSTYQVMVGGCALCFESIWSPAGKRMMFLILAIGVSVIGIILLADQPKGTPPSGPSSGDTRYDALQKRVASISDFDDLTTEGTAQYNALDWLANYDPAKITAENEHTLGRYALAVFFFSTSGKPSGKGTPESNWASSKNWMTGSGFCIWEGVECIDDDGKPDTPMDANGDVISLELTQNSMTGTIPSEVQTLSTLENLDLTENELVGTLPSELALIPTLKNILLRNNKIRGSIPTEFGGILFLNDLVLGENHMTGTVPPLGKNLRAMGLDKNKFTGGIPDLSGMTSLEIMYFDENRMDGTLPESMSQCTELADVRLRMNAFAGTIPPQLSSLGKLEILHLDNNALFGSLPDIFDQMSSLTQIQIFKNEFDGLLPPSLGTLSNLEYLQLDSNRFSGSIPESFSGLDSIQQLYLQTNRLQGSISSFFGDFKDLVDLRLQDNDLTGPIPSELAECSKLEHIYLHMNNLNGEVPTQLGSLAALKNFRLYNNFLEGSMPEEVCKLVDDDSLKFLAADCQEVSCRCCHKCY